MTTYSVDYLRRLFAAVEDFEAAFEAWMTTQVDPTTCHRAASSRRCGPPKGRTPSRSVSGSWPWPRPPVLQPKQWR